MDEGKHTLAMAEAKAPRRAIVRMAVIILLMWLAKAPVRGAGANFVENLRSDSVASDASGIGKNGLLVSTQSKRIATSATPTMPMRLNDASNDKLLKTISQARLFYTIEQRQRLDNDRQAFLLANQSQQQIDDLNSQFSNTVVVMPVANREEPKKMREKHSSDTNGPAKTVVTGCMAVNGVTVVWLNNRRRTVTDVLWGKSINSLSCGRSLVWAEVAGVTYVAKIGQQLKLSDGAFAPSHLPSRSDSL